MDIVEVCLSCVFLLGKSAPNRMLFRCPNVVTALKQILNSASAINERTSGSRAQAFNIQRYIAGTFADLVKEREGAYVILQTGPCISIVNLINGNAQQGTQQHKIGKSNTAFSMLVGIPTLKNIFTTFQGILRQ